MGVCVRLESETGGYATEIDGMLIVTCYRIVSASE